MVCYNLRMDPELSRKLGIRYGLRGPGIDMVCDEVRRERIKVFVFIAAMTTFAILICRWA